MGHNQYSNIHKAGVGEDKAKGVERQKMNLESSNREVTHHFRRLQIRLTADFSQKHIESAERKARQTRLQYSAKPSFKNKEKIMTFPDKQGLGKFASSTLLIRE